MTAMYLKFFSESLGLLWQRGVELAGIHRNDMPISKDHAPPAVGVRLGLVGQHALGRSRTAGNVNIQLFIERATEAGAVSANVALKLLQTGWRPAEFAPVVLVKQAELD